MHEYIYIFKPPQLELPRSSYCFFFRLELSFSDLLKMHRADVLPDSKDDKVRITVRRKWILNDCLHKLRNGFDTTKHLRVVFIGEPAVDDGGPLREFLYRLMLALSQNEMLFCGPTTSRVPRHNLVELERRTYFYIGVIIALSLIHGGPGPQFFSPAVADYIVYGVQSVKAKVVDVPDIEVREKIQKVSYYPYARSYVVCPNSMWFSCSWL